MDLSKLRYTETHEWINVEGDTATVGISEHAQKEISDVVFVELPAEGRALKRKDSAMVIESVKAAFDIYAPVSGTVTKVNTKLKEKPELVNRSPYEEGWLFQMKCSDPSEISSLLTPQQYENSQGSAAH